MLKKIFKAVIHYFHKLDKGLFAAVCGISVFSVYLMYILVQNEGKDVRMYKMQLICLCIGTSIALVMSALDYHWFTKLWFLYAPFAVGLTLLTFTSLGYQPVEGVDDKAWIKLGSMTMQPSEILKIAFIMTFAMHLSKVKEKINHFFNVVLLKLDDLTGKLYSSAVTFFFFVLTDLLEHIGNTHSCPLNDHFGNMR